MQLPSLALLAQTDNTNRWLNDNPWALALIFFAIGGALIAYGAWGLKSGRARGKYGVQFEGNTALLLSVIRLLGGLACCAFAIYQLLTG